MPVDDLNQVTILGRLGADPDLAYTGGGRAYCKLSIASNRYWRDAAGKQTSRTQWTRVVIWGKGAELAKEYLVKGQRVLVSGRLESTSWLEGDVRRYKTAVVATQIQYLDKPKGATPAPPEPAPDPMYDDADVPF